MIQSHKNVCVYGLGKLFEDTFEDRKLVELFHANYLSDSNVEKLSEGNGNIPYITLDKLREVDDLLEEAKETYTELLANCLVSEYQFSISHHTKNIFWDSVLYAWCE